MTVSIKEWIKNLHSLELDGAADTIEALLKENERQRAQLVDIVSFESATLRNRIKLLEKVVEAAKPLSDNLTCLDSEWVHQICILNRALAELKAQATPESSAPVQHTDSDR